MHVGHQAGDAVANSRHVTRGAPGGPAKNQLRSQPANRDITTARSPSTRPRVAVSLLSKLDKLPVEAPITGPATFTVYACSAEGAGDEV